MKAKEYLQQLRRLDTVINQKIKELEDLRIKVKGVGSLDYSKERVQTSPSGDAPFENIFGRIVDLEAEINREIDTFIVEKHEIINQIQVLKNSKYIEVLYKHYVEFKRLEVVAVEMNFTYQYVVELHGCALKEFQTTYENLLNSNEGK
ncbi:hypothetical protein AALA00_12140 [Lachnospiraceae bacterium 46-15]